VLFAYGSVPKDHIPTDYGVRLQFHIIVPINEINLSRIAEPKTANVSVETDEIPISLGLNNAK
jgi:hypothetical protein